MAKTPSANSSPAPGLKRLCKEPLLQFLCLGLLIFIVDSVFSSDASGPRSIVVDDQVVKELIDIFKAGQGRAPTRSEVENLIVTYTQNEVLFREGQQLRLHEGDEMIRSRLVLKMRNILLNKVVLEEPTDAELLRWFEDNRDFYNAQGQVTLELTGENLPDATAAQTIAQQVNAGEVTTDTLSNLKTFADRPEHTLTAFLEVASIPVLLSTPINQWAAVQTRRSGWRLGRITSRSDAEEAEFQQVRSRVLKDWLRVSKEKQLARQTKAIIDQYDIQVAPSQQLLDQYQLQDDAVETADTDRVASNQTGQEG